jgi:hypothetical protein
MKKGKKKIYFIVAFVLVLVLASGVFAQSIGLSGKAKEAVNEIVENQGIDKNKVQSVEKVDFDSLPSQVDLKNIDTTNLAVYEVNYGGEAPVFVITASDQLFEAQTSDTVYKRMLLTYGINGEVSDSTFLNTGTGVETSLEKGYVMMRGGSITGLSTNLEVLSGEGSIEIIVYINGVPAGFRNTIAADSTEVKKDYDTQSIGIVKFDKGDVISTYIIAEGDIIVKDIINLLEISTE